VDTSAAAHVFVADLDAPVLQPTDEHHLRRVLRLRDGDIVTASDGRGRWRRCRLGAPLVPLDEPVLDPRVEPPITIAFALVKGERPELVVQKLTEVGVDRIVPFTAARSVVRWDAAKAAHQHERFGTVARLAAMQSRRPWLPEIEPVTTFEDLAARPGVVLADASGEPPSLAGPFVAVGPEGGWSDEERRVLLPRVRLATTVLRAETAAIAAGVLLTSMRATIVLESHGA